ncbi:MAG: NmrA family NAD(P)-binding protein, partial [Salinivenus sp.]
RQWMSLDDDRMPTLMEHYKVPHCDAKGEANQAFTDRGVPTTFLLTSFYWENLLQGMVAPSADGVLTLTLPMGDAKLPGIAAEDIGRCAYALFQDSSTYIGRTVGIAGEHLTGVEMTSALSDALGTTVHYHAVDPATYREFGFPGAEDLGNMFQFKRDFNDDFCDARNVSRSRQLNPDLQSFDDWLAVNKRWFSLPQPA